MTEDTTIRVDAGSCPLLGLYGYIDQLEVFPDAALLIGSRQRYGRWANAQLVNESDEPIDPVDIAYDIRFMGDLASATAILRGDIWEVGVTREDSGEVQVRKEVSGHVIFGEVAEDRNGWTLLKTVQVAPIWVPFVPEGSRIALRRAVYSATTEIGNTHFVGDRLVGFGEVEGGSHA